MSRLVPLALALAALTLSACGDDDEGGDLCGGSDATMRPGEDCAGCHASLTRTGGTVYPRSDPGPCDGLAEVTVTIVHHADQTLTRTSNSAGNFHASTDVGADFTATLTYAGNVVTRAHTGASGACNACHSPAGQHEQSIGTRLTIPTDPP